MGCSLKLAVTINSTSVDSCVLFCLLPQTTMSIELFRTRVMGNWSR